MSENDQKPTAWAKLNAYGFVLAGLGVMAGLDLIHPGSTDLARLAGDIPPGQAWWTVAIVLAGLLLLIGFIWVDRLAESAGLVILNLAIAAQTVVSYALIGWSDFTLTRIAILAIMAGCAWARISVLWSREGLAINIEPRRIRRKGRR